VTLREEHRLRVFDNRGLWRIFVSKREEIGRRLWHMWERREIHTECWWGNLKEGDRFGLRLR
jgi:hypothetical protein